MNDTQKTKAELLDKVNQLRQRVEHLETVEAQHQQAEEALRKSEENYRHLVESTSDWVWSIDTNGQHTFSNSAVEQLLGYKVDEIVGTSAFPLMNEDDQNHIRDMVDQAIQQRIGWTHVVIRWLHKDGSVRYFESTAQPVIDQHGHVVGFNGIDRDITERKLNEEALQASEERYRAVVENAAEGIIVVQDDQRVYF